MEWDKSWLKELDRKLKLYPLQLANIYRIEKNDAVFIFDEVGTGKTIESGLMAKHYIYNFYKNCNIVENKDKYLDACVITINANVTNESFEKKWRELVGLENGMNINGNIVKIEFCNNLNTGIKRIADRYDRIGMLIIDEAHYFVASDENERTKEIKKLKADKIVYLTATPIKYTSVEFNEENKKNWIKEYNKYNDLTLNIISNKIIKLDNNEQTNIDTIRNYLSKNLYNAIQNDKEFLKEKMRTFCWENNARNVSDIESEDILNKIGYVDFTQHLKIDSDNLTIANKFDYYSTVTRYFKTTVIALDITNVCKKAEIKRNLVEIINTDTQKVPEKSEIVSNYIEQHINDDPLPRFVIFTREYWEQEELVKALDKNGYKEFDFENLNNNEKKTYQVINGKTDKTKIQYCTEKTIPSYNNEIPRVLIVNYQIAEAGIDLPSYSHIINFYISAFPSSLEQRFGRIDRLNAQGKSVYENITMVYVLGDKNDNNTKNFNLAIYSYLSNLNSINFPVKNVLFDKEGKIFENWNNDPKIAIEYYSEMYDYIDDNCNKEELNNIFEWYRNWKNNNHNLIDDITDKANQIIDFIRFKDYEKLYNYKEKYEKSNNQVEKEALIKKYFDYLKEKIKLLKNNQEDKKIDDDIKELLLNNSDKIFYYNTNKKAFDTMDANKCAEDIYNNEKYKNFITELIELGIQ